jgi:5-methylcytosine-specific restriction endonuclease McrA
MEQELVELVWRRANSRCEYCRLPQEFSLFTFEIDHIIARKHGGPTAAANLCLACFYCNGPPGKTSSYTRSGWRCLEARRVSEG